MSQVVGSWPDVFSYELNLFCSLSFLYSPLLPLLLRLLSPGVSASVRVFTFSHSFFLPYYLYFLTALPVLLSPCFSLLLIFASGSSSFFLLGLIRLAFRTPYSLLGWSVFASSSAVVLSFLLGSLFSFFVLLPSQLFFRIYRFPSRLFLSFHRLCARLCVVSYGSLFFFSLFASFLLLRGLAAFPKLCLLRSCFSWGFLFFTGFIFGSFTYEFWWCSMAGLGAPFSYLSFVVGFLLFLSFIGFSLASALLSLVLFLLPSSVHLLSASLPFPGLCAFLSRSLPVRPASLSFFRISSLMSVPAFVPLFSCTVSSSSSPQFSSVLFVFSVLSSRYSSFVLCLFFVAVQPFPVLVFHASFRSSSWVIPLFWGFGLCSLASCGAYGFGCYSTFVSSFGVPLSSAPPFVCSGS